MGELLERVRTVVRENRYVFSDHGDDMLRERSILHKQIVDGLRDGRLLAERPAARPKVWAYVQRLDFAKLVTVHFLDR